VKCTGATASLCLALQAAGKEECDWQYDYDCLFTSQYFDGSTFFGRVVNGSITLPMLDKTERNVFGLFGYPPRSSVSLHLEFIFDHLLIFDNYNLDEWD
jgi:hypothetical protein